MKTFMEQMKAAKADDQKWPQPSKFAGIGAAGGDRFGRPKKTCLDQSERSNGFSREAVPSAAERSEIVLTEEQSAAVEALRSFVRSDKKLFLLSGYAGTGKTTVLQHWLRDEKASPQSFTGVDPISGETVCRGSLGLRVAFAAPTNKATKVLYGMAAQQGLRVECSTVHKLLKLKVMSDAEKRYAARKGSVFEEAPISEYDVVVVDECSMVGNKSNDPRRQESGLYDILTEEADRYGVQIVFVGDSAQLPPVGELDSPCFEVRDKIQLTHVVRQALDNPILELATWLRTGMEGDPGPEPKLPNMKGARGVELLDSKAWLRAIVEAYAEDPASPANVRVLAARNLEVDQINKHVRRELLGDDAEPFLPGERLIATSPVAAWDKEEVVGVAMTTDEEAVVLGSQRARHPLCHEYKAWEVEMRSDSNELPFTAYIVDPSDYAKWQADIEAIGKREAQGLRRFWMKWERADMFAAMKHVYACTVHRSQGSTYRKVFVDRPDIMSFPGDERMVTRMLYTAVTRPSEVLVLC